MMIFGCVHPDELDKYWELAAPLIDKALKRNDYRYKLGNIEAAIKNGAMFLWVAEDTETLSRAAAVTNIIHYPDRSALVILYCGGENHRDWVDCLKYIIDYAKGSGCSEIEIYGRKGWVRALKKYGFKIDSYVMRCKLK